MGQFLTRNFCTNGFLTNSLEDFWQKIRKLTKIVSVTFFSFKFMDLEIDVIFNLFRQRRQKNFSRCWCTLNTNHWFDFTTLMNFNFWHFDAKIAFCAFFFMPFEAWNKPLWTCFYMGKYKLISYLLNTLNCKNISISWSCLFA